MPENRLSFIKRITINNRRFIHVSIAIGYPVILVLLSLPYLLWEIYWARRVGYLSIKWHTHLMVYYYLWLIGWLLLYYLFSAQKRNVYLAEVTFYTAFIGSLFIAESALLTLKVKQTTLESLGGGYYSWYDASHESWYHLWDASKPHWLVKQEYKYIRNANSLGFSDMEWPVEKLKNEKRILSLGDSFTEGDGAPYDSSYVAQLREKLCAADSNFYVMNAGTCGCDPFVNFVNYRDRLQPYQPDFILQTLSSGDMNVDIIVRGGMERFRPDGKVQFRKGPVWEPIYAISNISRLYFSALGYNQLLMKESQITDNKPYLDSIVVKLFKDYAAFTKKNNCKLIIVLQPFKDEVDSKKYDYNFEYIISHLKNTDNIEILDLMPFYLSYIKDKKSTSKDYYWPIDGHHNSTGYTMMAEGISTMLLKQ